MARVVITGAGGFLGSHLCDRFVAEGYEVVAVDNFSTGSPPIYWPLRRKSTVPQRCILSGRITGAM